MCFTLTRGLKLQADRHFEICNKVIGSGYTQDNLDRLVNLTNLSTNLAKRYFKTKCGECGGVVKYEDVAMFLRYRGRYANLKEDPRDYLCKECLSKNLGIDGKKYWLTIYENYKNSCYLFS